MQGSEALSLPCRQAKREKGLTPSLPSPPESVGDGRLKYRTENVLEAYYRIGLLLHADVSVDFQRIAHPAYNADRGPASFIGLRLHVER